MSACRCHCCLFTRKAHDRSVRAEERLAAVEIDEGLRWADETPYFICEDCREEIPCMCDDWCEACCSSVCGRCTVSHVEPMPVRIGDFVDLRLATPP